MDDAEIIQRIDELVDREHHLERQHVGSPLNDTERDELAEIEVKLDQCWDLLRQRQARREFGQNPDDATVRSEQIVEHYKQ